MNLNKQQTEILAILQHRGSLGMNSYEYRMKYIQLPVRIKELKSHGYRITTRSLKNRSVDYILEASTILQFKSNGTKAPTITPLEPKDHILVIKTDGQPVARYVTKTEYEAYNAPQQKLL